MRSIASVPCAGACLQRLAERVFLRVLRLLRRLPEEQIRADGGAENGHYRRPKSGARGYRRQDKTAQRLAPGNLHDHQSPEIREEGQGQPPENLHVAFVGDEDLEGGAEDAEEDDIKQVRAADQEGERIAHGAEVGADIDRVGDQEKGDDALQQPGRIVLANIAGDAMSGRAADAGADLLNRAHQRIGEEHCPGDRVAELTTRLRIGGYAAGIVIGCPGDEARPQYAKQARLLGRRMSKGAGSSRALPHAASESPLHCVLPTMKT